jgi:hypothetical protein
VRGRGGQHCPKYIDARSIKLKLSILAQGSKGSRALYAAVDKDKRIKNNRQQQGIWVYLFHHYIYSYQHTHQTCNYLMTGHHL